MALAFCFDSAHAQSVTIIENAYVLIGDGTVIESGTVVVRGDKIAAVGADVSPPMNPFARPTRIDAEGKFVTPGLIDSWSTIGTRIGGGEGRAYGLAADAFDAYSEDELNDALRQGVTAAYLPARVRSGIGGIGAVVRLIPGGARDAVLLSERAALSTVLAGSRPLARVREAQAVRKAFREALEYRESLETYEEDLKEYEKDLAEWVKKQEEKEAEEAEESVDGAKAGSQPASTESKPANKPRRRGKRGPKPTDDKPEEKQADAGKPSKEENGKKGDKGEDAAPEKPTKPPRSPDKDVLLEVIDGELFWRVEAYRPADMLNAIEIADEFNLALVFEGATGSHEVANQLVDREIAVVIDARAPDVRYLSGIQRDRYSSEIGALATAGVDVLVASGPRGVQSSPNLAARAAQAVAMGLDEADAFSAITSSAARTLGVGDQIGRIEAGMGADLVIWSDHPFAAGARVERVFIAGQQVYSADEANAEQED